MTKMSNYQIQHQVGKQGETLFFMPIADRFAHMEDQLKEDGLRDLLNRSESYGDDRSKVLVGALAAEAVLDKALGILLPKYLQAFDNKKELTFSIKTKILRAMAVIPPHLLEALDILRGIRNAFAHDIKLDELDKIPEKLIDKMENFYVRREIEPQEKRKDIHHLFDTTVQIATIGIYAYFPLIQDLKETIRNPTFEENLRNQAEQRDSAQQALIWNHLTQPASEGDAAFGMT
jgi:uncharacterized protein YutE (UPF0331/DUF86 family)